MQTHVHVRYAVARLPVVCLSVTLVHPKPTLSKFSAIFLRHLVRWPSADIKEKFYGDHPRGTLRRGTYTGSQIQRYWTYIEGYVSETVQDRR